MRHGIANMLSLCNVQNKYKVDYDRSLNTGFVVHMANGTNCVFMPSKKSFSSLIFKRHCACHD